MNLGKRKKHVIRTDRDKYIHTKLTSGFDRYHDNTILGFNLPELFDSNLILCFC